MQFVIFIQMCNNYNDCINIFGQIRNISHNLLFLIILLFIHKLIAILIQQFNKCSYLTIFYYYYCYYREYTLSIVETITRM